MDATSPKLNSFPFAFENATLKKKKIHSKTQFNIRLENCDSIWFHRIL